MRKRVIIYQHDMILRYSTFYWVIYKFNYLVISNKIFTVDSFICNKKVERQLENKMLP